MGTNPMYLCCVQGPLVALAFKLEEGRFGQLTYMRIYSGTVRKGDPIVNATTGKRIKVCLVPFTSPPCNKQITVYLARKLCQPFSLRLPLTTSANTPCSESVRLAQARRHSCK